MDKYEVRQKVLENILNMIAEEEDCDMMKAKKKKMKPEISVMEVSLDDFKKGKEKE